MKYLFLYLALSTFLFASLENINSFQADFTQTVIDDKGKVLTYNGRVVASKPQNALWNYLKPVTKDIYINADSITVIEPEIEQVIIRKIESNFDFFNMIRKAKKTDENSYLAMFKNSKFIIKTENSLIKSISYSDEFENSVQILFENQKQNEEINEDIYTPNIPLEFDIIRD